MSPDSPFSIWTGIRFARALLVGLVLLASGEPLTAQSQIAATNVNGKDQDGSVPPVAFAIPSQQLETALKAFSAAAQVELFYESDAISGRQSFAVNGTFVPEVAMRTMLQGTGLSSTSFDRGTITILSVAKGREAAELRLAKQGIAEFSSYLALVQKSLDQTFCRATIAASDPDELLARLWISPSGSVQRADLLSSAGSDERDRLYLAMLATVAIGERPPAAMPQPVNLMLMPKRTQSSAACQSIASQRTRSAAHE